MKRTRQVEVIRYSRRSTVISNEGMAEPDLAADQASIDLLLGMPDVSESPIEEAQTEEQQTSGAGVTGRMQGRWPLRFLKQLIRG